MIIKIGRVFFCFTGCPFVLVGVVRAFGAGSFNEKLSSICSGIAIAGIFVSMAIALKPKKVEEIAEGK